MFFSAVSCYCSSFISCFIWVICLPCKPGQRFVNSLYPFKEQTLGFIDIFSIFLNLYFVYLLSDLCYLLLLLNVGFVCSFSNSFRWWIRLFILYFSCFLKNACVNFPLRIAFAACHRFWMVVFLLLFAASRYFLIFSLISSLIHCVLFLFC